MDGSSNAAASALFPTLRDQRVCEVNLDSQSRLWAEKHPDLLTDKNAPLLDPALCSRMVLDTHRALAVDWSFGGYLEDRTFLWRGSYLEQNNSFVHLGVDFNVPAETPVCCPVSGQVIRVDDDRDENGGWGPRVLVSLYPPKAGVALIFAHLGDVEVSPGLEVRPGTMLGTVGSPPSNGNWFPHLHVQAATMDFLTEVLATDIARLDGYGRASELVDLAKIYPDPFAFLGA